MDIPEVELHIVLKSRNSFLLPIEEVVQKVEHRNLVREVRHRTWYEFSVDAKDDGFSFLDVDV